MNRIGDSMGKVITAGGVLSALAALALLVLAAIQISQPKHTAPPPGFVIITDGVYYRSKHVKTGVTSFDKNTKQEAIDFAWGLYDMMNHERKRVWKEVKQK